MRHVAIGDGRRDHTRVDHLERLVGGKRGVELLNDDGFQTSFRERFVQRNKAFEVGAAAARPHLTTRKLIDGGERCACLVGHQHFVDLEACIREIHLRATLRRVGDERRDDVAASVEQCARQLIAGHGRHNHLNPQVSRGLEFLVHPALELDDRIRRDAPLGRPIEEEMRAIGGDQHPDLPTLEDFVQIARVRLDHQIEDGGSRCRFVRLRDLRAIRGRQIAVATRGSEAASGGRSRLARTADKEDARDQTSDEGPRRLMHTMLRNVHIQATIPNSRRRVTRTYRELWNEARRGTLDVIQPDVIRPGAALCRAALALVLESSVSLPFEPAASSSRP